MIYLFILSHLSILLKIEKSDVENDSYLVLALKLLKMIFKAN